jgi:predicted amidophosphoribosyltransferase
MRYKLEGNWRFGMAYDLHTLNSEYLGKDEYGHDRFNNTRSEMGELVYQLKYQHDETVVNKIVDLLQNINGLEKMEAIIPIPPSNKNRTNQPVFSIALELAKRIGIPVYLDFLAKINGAEELKSMEQEKRAGILEKTMYIENNHDLAGKKVLLIDDLYRSGSTLNAATNLLYNEAKVDDVCVLTMTKTRSNR